MPVYAYTGEAKKRLINQVSIFVKGFIQCTLEGSLDPIFARIACLDAITWPSVFQHMRVQKCL